MKSIAFLTALVIAVTPAFSADTAKPPVKKTEPAKKPEPKKNVPKKPAAPRVKTDMIEEDTVALLKPYDKNSDFEIDVEEFKAIEAEFKKNPKGPLKQFDKGKDGALDAMMDRTGLNVKLGGAAPKKGATPATPKKPNAPKPAAKPAAKPAEPKKPV